MTTISGEEVNLVLAACEFPPVDTALADVVATQISAKIECRNEAAMLLAHLMFSSDGFRRREEIDGQRNDHTPYHGRGFIELSFIYNYLAASHAIFDDDRLHRNPELVSESDELSMKVAMWFWKQNVPADGPNQNNFGLTTKAIDGVNELNAGHPKALRRYELYRKAATALGVTRLAINKF